VIDEVRKSHASRDYLPVIRSIDFSIKTEKERFRRHEIGSDYSIGWVKFAPLPLNDEIAWSASRLSLELATLSKHVLLRERTAQAVARGDLPTVLSLLDEHEAQFGQSFWSVQTRISAIGIFRSAASARELTKQIRQLTGRSVISYVASMYAQRVDPSVSLAFFESYAARRIDRIPNKELVAFVRYTVLGRVPEGSADQAKVLAFAQNLCDVDQFETLVAVLVDRETQQERSFAIKDFNASALLIRDAGDARIEKALSVLSGAIKVSDCPGLSALVSGNVVEARRLLHRIAGENPTSAAAIASHAIALSLLRAPKSIRPKSLSPIEALPLSLRDRVLRSPDDTAAIRVVDTDASKFCTSFSNLPVFKGLRAFLDALQSSDVVGTVRLLGEMAANSSESSPFDLAMTRTFAAPFKVRREDLPASSAIDFVWNISVGTPHYGSGALAPDAESLSRAFGLVASGQDEQANPYIERALSSKLRVVSASSAALALTAWAALGDVDRACEVIVQECVRHRTPPDSLPIANSLSRFEWTHYAKARRLEEVAICLYLYSRVARDDRAGSLRYFALDSMLSSFGVDRPSRLPECNLEIPEQILDFFLGKACTVDVLDMLLSMDSSKDVLEERAKVCSYLVGRSDTSYRHEYQEELLSITRELAVERGIRAIDASRVHVDDRILSSQLKNEFSEGFDRLMRLTADEVGKAETFDEAIRAATRQLGSEQSTFQIPESEADDLLVSMILRAREAFLFDVPAGLDSYLSKRVRHGSIVGYLRAHSEQEGLATSKLSSGEYEPSDSWVIKPVLATVDRAKIASALATFSKQLDEVLIRLRDSILHVRSPSHPQGVFDVVLKPAAYRLIRSASVRDQSIEAFVTTLLASLWALLSPSLSKAAGIIEDDSKRQIGAAFDSLRCRIGALRIDAELNARIQLSIGRARVATDTALSQCADWFRPSNMNEEQFTCEELVNVSEKMVRSVYSDFACELTVENNATFAFPTPVFLVLSDALFVMLGNVARWGRCDKVASVLLRVDADQQKKTVNLRVENELRAEADVDSVAERIEKTKLAIENRESVRYARSEGGSGLHKLANVIEYSRSASLDFGLDEKNWFFAEARFSVEFTGGQNASILAGG
jgi:hypothetical protein